MEKIKISAIQMNSKIGDINANIEKVKTLIERDVEHDVDIIVLPEVWTVGWAPKRFQESAEELAARQLNAARQLRSEAAKFGQAPSPDGEGWDGVINPSVNNEISQEQLTDKSLSTLQPFNLSTKNSHTSIPPYLHTSLNFLSSIACTYSAWVIGGSIITKQDDKFYNTCPVFNRQGELVAAYSKNHLFSYYGSNEGSYVEKGKTPVMVDIEGVKVGLTICYDIRFPEIYRAYRKAGADLLINCAAWGLKKPIPWECMTRCRAVENQAYFVALTQSGYIEDGEWNIGHSRIIDYKGETISEIKDQKEGTMTAVIDLNPMYDFREKCRCIDDIRDNYEVKIL